MPSGTITPLETQEEILRLYLLRVPQLEIARRLGVSRDTVNRYVMKAKDDIATELDTEDYQAIFRETYQRLIYYEQQALERRHYRTAMDVRAQIVRLLGIAKPDTLNVIQSGGPTFQVNIVRPDDPSAVSVKIVHASGENAVTMGDSDDDDSDRDTEAG